MLVTRPINLLSVAVIGKTCRGVQVNSAPARGPDHFPFQGFRDSGIGSQGITNSLEMMVKTVRTRHM